MSTFVYPPRPLPLFADMNKSSEKQLLWFPWLHILGTKVERKLQPLCTFFKQKFTLYLMQRGKIGPKFRNLKGYTASFPTKSPAFRYQKLNGQTGIQDGLVAQRIASPDFLLQYFLFLLMSLSGFGITVSVAS